MSGVRVPETPSWVKWALDRLADPDDVRVVLSELAELHAVWLERDGASAADRRYLRQLRQYPLHLLADKLRNRTPLSLPGIRDVVYAVRGLSRAPGLSLSVVLTVGIGIGGCATIFSVVDALYLRALPYESPDRIGWIYTDSPPNQWPLSVVDYQALVEQQTSFASVGAYGRGSQTFLGDGEALLLPVFTVTPGLFETLGVSLLSGRYPTQEEGRPEAPATVVVTRGFASRQLGSVQGDGSDALGRTFSLDGVQHEVIGVLPSGNQPLWGNAEVLPTLQLEPPGRKGPFFLRAVGRLRPGVDAAVAAAELREINARLFPLWQDSYQDDRASWGMRPLEEVLQGDVNRLLTVLMGSVVLLLLVATTNAANLLMTRRTARKRELAIRVALGASRRRIGGHLLAETLVLACGGIAVGLLIADVAIDLLPTLAGTYIPRLDEAGLTGRTFGFAGALSLGSALLFGVLPAANAGRDHSAADAIRSSGGSVGRSRNTQRVQRWIVAGQFAIAVPLLAGAALLMASFTRLQRVDPGFDPDHLLSVQLQLPGGVYPDGEARKQFWDPMLQRVRALPGVLDAGLASAHPGRVYFGSNNFDLEDKPTPPGQSQPSVPWIAADPEFFKAAGIPLLEGRMLEEADELAPEPVVLVDAAWARRFFPGESAVGRRMRSGGETTGPWTTVVGVVGTIPYRGRGRPASGAVYYPDPARDASAPYMHVRTEGDPEAFIGLIRDEVRRLGRSVPITRVVTGRGALSESLTEPRHLTLLLSTFAIVALLLAIVGLYGVISYSVQQRRGDIALRLALGGAPASIRAMIMRQNLTLAAGGLGLGIAVSLAVTRVLSSLLYDTSATDPGALVAVSTLMSVVAVLATLVPVQRALRVDPASALREE